METNDFVITREFDVSQETLWKALTDPQALAQWWGPKGFTWISCTLELKPGGAFHYGMRAPNNGPATWGKWVYAEIVEPSKIVFVSSFADEAGNIIRAPFSAEWPLEVHNTWTLEEHDGKTSLTLRGYPINATEAELKAFDGNRGHMQRGFGGTFDQLAAYLART